MKYSVFLILILISAKSFAQTSKVDSALFKISNQKQPSLPTKLVINHINEEVYIYDAIFGYKKINDTLQYLYIGGRYPKQKVTILVEGKINREVSFKTGDTWHFNGKVFIYKGKPTIIIKSSDQLGTLIQI